MSEPDGTPDVEPEPDPDEEDLFLSQSARVEITAGTQFTYRGNSHWPKVMIADGPLVIEGEDGTLQVEDGEFLLYRVQELTHRTLRAVIARMKVEIDARHAEDAAARTGAAPTTPAANG